MSPVIKEIAPDDNAGPWMMNEMQVELDQIIEEARAAGRTLSPSKLSSILRRATKGAGKALQITMLKNASEMLTERRKERFEFETRNFQRWRKSFDLIETIWVSCEEVGRTFNQIYRPEAAEKNDYVFEALTSLQAKALLVTSEVICLLKGGFADAALSRWRTLYEINVVMTLIRQEGQDLAVRYLAHSRVQAWNDVRDDPADDDEDRLQLKMQAEYALEKFGADLNRRNGWASKLTGQKNPTFEKLARIAGSSGGMGLYKQASLHIHGNHRWANDLLGICEAQSALLLVGPSNSGMVAPLTLTAIALVESTAMLILTKSNIDHTIFVEALWRMAYRMNALASGIEKRTFEAAKKRKTP